MLSCRVETMVGYLLLPDGQQIEVRDGLLLGRIAACDILIDDTKASRRHARVRVEGSVAEIEDLDSSNGTLLNGKRVQRRTLRAGDVIQIGAVRIEYRDGAVPAAAAQKPAPPAGDELVFEDEAPPEPAKPTYSSAVPPVASPPPRVAEPPPRPATTPPPAPPPPAPSQELEFLDEVVQVRTPAPAAQKPGVAGKPSGAAPARERGVLQYHKKTDRGGLLGDDLAQMSGMKRGLLLLFALVFVAVLGYLAMVLAG